MFSLILSTATRFQLPVILLYSLLLLLRGHNEPGGGFAGGLVAAAAFTLYLIGHDLRSTQRIMRVNPRKLIGAGLLTAATSGLLGVLRGRPYLTAVWSGDSIAGNLGTPLLFDVGVYLVVLGVIMTIVFTLTED